MIETAPQLDQIASRALTLYTRPTVALELMRLAEEPRVDAKALKECIAQDPALTCKVLRVVNSSLFGLNRPVADLSQAIGLLGIKSLKLLVLGFNLPDTLFAEVAAEQLQWYWTNTLTRAVAARMLCEQLWRQSGEEAFIAGLLQDIGILVLLRELGEPYAKFLSGVIEEKCHLASLEHDSMGFDHVQLSAALLAQWQLPERLVEAIATPKRPAKLARLNSPEGDLPQILHLAEMLMQLVGQRRFRVLPDLLEAGRVYRGMTKPKLASLVEGLQPQVDQLASVLSLELTEERDYVQMLIDAHHQMAELSEQIAGEARTIKEDQAYNQLLTHTHELSAAMQAFLEGREEGVASETLCAARQHGAHEPDAGKGRGETQERSASNLSVLARKLAATANRCRERRRELSLLIVEPNVYDIHSDSSGEGARRDARRALEIACKSVESDKLTVIALSEKRTAAIVTDCERRSALALAQSVIAEIGRLGANACDADLATTLAIGVATLSVVPRNFDPTNMIESATRCLSAARACGISAVKSIEV
jgi:HD-like signal output (HDOD) protein